ncbi:MAG: zinc protease, partial [Bacteroidota bacterium]|nr:zinc protease [Bacteroidota bacterium]
MQEEKPKQTKDMMINTGAKRFISDLNFNKFERKNCISKICGMSLTNSLRILLLAFLAFPTLLKAQTETTISGNLLYAKIQNGLNVIVMPTPGTGNVEVTMLIRTGCSYETDSLSGMASVIHNILAEKINKRLRNNNSSISFQNTTFDDYSSTEHSVFKINTSAVNLNQCLYLLRDSVFNVKITGEEISRWISAGLKTLEEARYDKRKVFEDKVLKALFKQDHAKLEISGNPNSLKNITGSALRNFYARYYVCNNSVAVITGNFTPTVVRDQFDAIFNTLIKSEFNPENITKIVDIRPTAYTTQFVVEDTIKNPEFQICWQFPGTSANERESRYGYLLNAMLDDKNNYIHAKLTKMGCKVFRVEYEANNFSGIFRITFQPSKQNFFSTFNFIVDQVDKLDKNLLNETMMNAG